MQKKVFFSILAIIFSLILISAIIILNIPKQIKYSDDPKTWIETKAAGIKEVSVDKVTKGKSFIDPLGQQYRSDKIITVFDYEGFYKGRYFKSEYIEENKILMRISQTMNANDGIIEGFIVEEIKEGIPVAYIFLDEDWKELVGPTNIFWGAELQNEQPFSYTQVDNGIYMNTINDDQARFSEDYRFHYGSIIVGDLTRENQVNATLIRFV